MLELTTNNPPKQDESCMSLRATLAGLSLLGLSITPAFAEPLLTPFSTLHAVPGGGWEPLEFPRISRKTTYQLIEDDGLRVVQADTQASASGLITRLHQPAEQAPWLRWRWKVSNVYAKGDATRKDGDDYPVRLYVAFAFEPERASWFERTRRAAAELLYGNELPGTSLNYIWDNRLAVGSTVTNPYSEETRMIVVNQGTAQVGEWVSLERNIVADYRAAFGREPPPLVGIGIMSDSDNTGESARAWYGDIRLDAR